MSCRPDLPLAADPSFKSAVATWLGSLSPRVLRSSPCAGSLRLTVGPAGGQSAPATRPGHVTLRDGHVTACHGVSRLRAPMWRQGLRATACARHQRPRATVLEHHAHRATRAATDGVSAVACPLRPRPARGNVIVVRQPSRLGVAVTGSERVAEAGLISRYYR